jgi:hypothetical protein
MVLIQYNFTTLLFVTLLSLTTFSTSMVNCGDSATRAQQLLNSIMGKRDAINNLEIKLTIQNTLHKPDGREDTQAVYNIWVVNDKIRMDRQARYTSDENDYRTVSCQNCEKNGYTFHGDARERVVKHFRRSTAHEVTISNIFHPKHIGCSLNTVSVLYNETWERCFPSHELITEIVDDYCDHRNCFKIVTLNGDSSSAIWIDKEFEVIVKRVAEIKNDQKISRSTMTAQWEFPKPGNEMPLFANSYNFTEELDGKVITQDDVTIDRWSVAPIDPAVFTYAKFGLGDLFVVMGEGRDSFVYDKSKRRTLHEVMKEQQKLYADTDDSTPPTPTTPAASREWPYYVAAALVAIALLFFVLRILKARRASS